MPVTCKSSTGKHYPSADKWMWNYCIYLGSVSYNGHNYDLGVYMNNDGTPSAAIVTGHQDGDYMSGSLEHREYLNELYMETLIRYLIFKGNCDA